MKKLFAAVPALLAAATGLVAISPARPFEPPILNQTPLLLPSAIIPGPRATALFWVGTNCPISNRYAPFMSAIGKELRARGVQTVLVYSNAGTTEQEAAKHAKAYGLDNLPRYVDRDQKLARAANVSVTPEAVVIDAEGIVRYQGRLDDEYQSRVSARAIGPNHHELTDALRAIIAGKSVLFSKTRAVGCAIEWTKTPKPVKPTKDNKGAKPKTGAVVPAGAPTFADVAPILNQNCVSCHRSGEIGPMALDTYKSASRYAGNIVQVTEARQMPPWKPVAGHAVFDGERRLTDTQITTLAQWAKAGAPLGDPNKVPASPTFAKGWQLGEPDLILAMPEKWHMAANAKDIYRCFVLPTGLREDREVVAVEYRTGNKAVVHHVIGYIDVSGKGRNKDAAEDGAGYTSFGGPGFTPFGDMGGWAPGNLPKFLPDGMARTLPAGSDLVMQVHYHADGKPEDDITQVGLYFAKKPVAKQYRIIPVAGRTLDIPPGEKAYTVTQSYPVPVDATIYSVTPHMHLLGRTFEMEATLPNGTKKPLIKIDDWDFNWQDTYNFKEPIRLPKGATVSLKATFDNSTGNVRNPNNPPQRVTWGEATTDEMCIGFLGFTADDENDPLIRLLDASRKRKPAK